MWLMGVGIRWERAVVSLGGVGSLPAREPGMGAVGPREGETMAPPGQASSLNRGDGQAIARGDESGALGGRRYRETGFPLYLGRDLFCRGEGSSGRLRQGTKIPITHPHLPI